MPTRNLEHRYRWQHTAALLWGAVLLVSLVLLVFRLDKTAIDSNLMTILPQVERADIRQALTTINDKQNRQVVVALRSREAISEKVLAAVASPLSSSLLTPLNHPDRLQAIGDGYQQLQPYRQQLLSTQDQSDLQTGNVDTVIARAQHQLFGFASVSRADLANDPLFLFQRYVMQQLPSGNGMRLQGHWLIGQTGETHVAVLPLMLNGSAFDLTVQQRVKRQLAQATAKAATHQVELLAVGAVVFAEHGFSQSQREMSTVGMGGLVGIVFLLLFAFRAVRPLVVLVVALTISLAVALNMTLWVFGSIHMVALLFSASIIGVSIDYGFHFLTDFYQHHDSARHSIKRIFSGLTLGLVSSIIAYGLFLCSGLLLLKQVAVLAIIGLPSMFLTVVLMIPLLYRQPSGIQTMPNSLTTIATAVVANPVLRSLARPKLALLAVSAALLVLLLIKPNDNVRNLQALSPKLLADEGFIRKVFKQPTVSAYVLLSSDNAQKLLEQESILINAFPSVVRREGAISTLLPDEKTQRINHQLYQHLYSSDAINPYRAQTGDSANFTTLAFKPLPIPELLQSQAIQLLFPQRLLSLPEKRMALLIPLAISPDEAKKNTALEVICDERASTQVNCDIVRPTQDLSDQFGNYRQRLSWLLVLVGAVMLILAAKRYGQRGIVIAALPLFCAISAMVLASFVGVPLSLFSTLGALLVLGMGLDYVIFLAESKQPQQVMVSLILSYLTTLLSFGLLAISHTVAVATFGLTTAIGMTMIVFLSPAVTHYDK